jgi:serine phosphatase RsbU (regulator of sigma subunit)
MGTIATVACAVLDPPYDTMTVALAGHPPPIIAAAGHRPWLAPVDPCPPVGTRLAGKCESTTIPLPPDAVVAFYTDGLIERRGETLDIGLERLRNAVSVDTPNNVARDIMRHAIGGYIPKDDIALVVMCRSATAEDASNAP